MSSRKIGRAVLDRLGGPPGTFSVYLDERDGKKVVIVEVASSRRVDLRDLPKSHDGLQILYKPQSSAKALAG